MLSQIEKLITGELIGCAFGSIPAFQRMGAAGLDSWQSLHTCNNSSSAEVMNCGRSNDQATKGTRTGGFGPFPLVPRLNRIIVKNRRVTAFGRDPQRDTAFRANALPATVTPPC